MTARKGKVVTLWVPVCSRCFYVYSAFRMTERVKAEFVANGLQPHERCGGMHVIGELKFRLTGTLTERRGK